jgi:hypothetical protein
MMRCCSFSSSDIGYPFNLWPTFQQSHGRAPVRLI